MTIFERTLFSEQLGRGRGVVVEGLAHSKFPVTQTEGWIICDITFWPRQTRHVANAVLLGIRYAERLHCHIVRDPIPECGFAGGPTKLRSLFETSHLRPFPTSKKCGSQSSSSATNDNNVGFGVKFFRSDWFGTSAHRDPNKLTLTHSCPPLSRPRFLRSAVRGFRPSGKGRRAGLGKQNLTIDLGASSTD